MKKYIQEGWYRSRTLACHIFDRFTENVPFICFHRKIVLHGYPGKSWKTRTGSILQMGTWILKDQKCKYL